jgi:hypothetical protein
MRKEGDLSMILAKALAAELLVFVLTCAVLFLPAGTLIWGAGWVFLALFFSFVALLACWLFRYDPGLLRFSWVGLMPLFSNPPAFCPKWM